MLNSQPGAKDKIGDNAHSTWAVDSLRLEAYASRDAMAAAAAMDIADAMCRSVARKGQARMIFAAAPSQAEMLKKLCHIPDLPWEQITAFHMDDYLGLPSDAKQRFSNWLDRHLYSQVGVGAVHQIPDEGDPQEICAAYSDLLRVKAIDIVCLGIGVNGHLAFNDPPVANFADPALVKMVELDEICRQQQVDDGCFSTLDAVPYRAVTLTIPCLMSAREAFCVVPGEHKRPAVRRALEGPVTAKCPASFLRQHPACTMYLDNGSNPNA